MSTEIAVYFAILAVAFFLNLVASFFVANAALKKGRSWAAFFWLSFFFSWIIMAIIIATVTPSNGGQPGATRPCPKCAEPISPKAVLCKHCQSEVLPAHDIEVPISEAGSIAAKKTMAGISLTLMAIGLLWIAIYYISGAQYPLGAATSINMENWNIFIGFGISILGFLASYAAKPRK